VGERARQAQEFLRRGTRADPDRVDATGSQSALEGEVLAQHESALNAGLHDDRVPIHGSGRGGERELLGGIVPGVGPEERDEVAEPLDERGVGIQAVLEVEASYEGAPTIPTGRLLSAGTNLRNGNHFRCG
jgi:hypothetical protein